MSNQRAAACPTTGIRIAALALSLGLALSSPGHAQARSIIAVFDMTSEGLRRIKPVELKRLTDYLANQLTAKGSFSVVPRDRLTQQLRAQKKTSFKKCFDQSCQIEIGRELAANKSLATKVIRFGKKCIVTATLYDLKTATTAGGANAKSKCTMDGLLKATEEIAAKLSGGAGSSGYSNGSSPSGQPAYASGSPGSSRVTWPPPCPNNKPQACLQRARTLKEQDQALMAALFAFMKAERRGRWRVRKLAGTFIKQLIQGYVPRQTQLEDALKAACRRRAGACYAMGMLRAAEKLYPEALKHLRHACDKGELAACTTMGTMVNNGQGTVKDSPKAISLFKRSCDRNYLPACTELAAIYRYGSGGITKNVNRAVALYRRACNRHYLPACNKLAALYSWSERKDYRKALALYRRACDGGMSSACSSLAYMHKAGRGVPKNETKARAIYRKACNDGYVYACTTINNYTRAAKLRRQKCDSGDLYACNSLASMYKRGKGVPTNTTKANALYRRACGLGNLSACIAIKDNKRIIELYGRGCEGGNKHNCNALATRYKNGQGTLAKPQKAVYYYRKACDSKYAAACNSLAAMYRNAQGVPRNESKAMGLYRRSCSQGNLAGCEGAKEYKKMVASYRQRCNTGSMHNCNLLAVKYNMGQGVPKNQTSAANLFRKACNGNHMTACANLAYLYKNGQGVRRNSTTSRSLYKRACDGGYKAACSYGSSSSASGKRYQQYRHSCNNGNMADCNRVGASYSFGNNGAFKSKNLAATYYRKACTGGQMIGCSNLAVLYKNGQGVSRSDALSQVYFRKACKGGNKAACTSVRASSAGRSSSSSSYARASSSSSSGGKRYRQHLAACNRGNAHDCERVGSSYKYGISGAPKLPSLAVKYYRKACDLRRGSACAKLAGSGSGSRYNRSSTRTKGYLEHKRRCNLGSMKDCNTLGGNYSFGSKGAMKSKILARVYYLKACRGGNAMGCTNAAFFYKTGRGGKRDPIKARKYYRKACNLGHRGSCSQR
ncbi:MAG: SEL1-like repeat protein [Deltaproteobacteria bacterium]|nr:SEL1-like repeat protein [Deltaproteobacteria bacterium]